MPPCHGASITVLITTKSEASTNIKHGLSSPAIHPSRSVMQHRATIRTQPMRSILSAPILSATFTIHHQIPPIHQILPINCLLLHHHVQLNPALWSILLQSLPITPVVRYLHHPGPANPSVVDQLLSISRCQSAIVVVLSSSKSSVRFPSRKELRWLHGLAFEAHLLPLGSSLFACWLLDLCLLASRSWLRNTLPPYHLMTVFHGSGRRTNG